MTTRLVDDELLQRFHDGDTSDAESADVRAKLDASATDRAALAQLEKLTALFADVAADDVRAASPELDALYARVQAKVGTAKPAPVVDLAARRAARGRGVRPWLPVLALAAAAALVLVFISPGILGIGDPAVTPTVPPGSTGTPPATHVEPPAVEVGSRVLDADFGSGAGTFFQVNGGEGAQVAVVWLDEAE